MKGGTTCFFIFFISFCFSQNEVNHWYFGDKAGLYFDKGKATVVNDSKMIAPAGCTSISDINGNLLFYSNGETIWNKNHKVMENGSNLQGNTDHFQNSIIIPKPNSSEIYYLFYSKNTLPPGTSGFFVAEIEISAKYPNGIVKDRTSLLKSSSTERISAIHHKNGTSIWLITFNYSSSTRNAPINTITAFEIDENGIKLPAVNSISSENALSKIGSVKVSPDGTMLAISDYGESYIFLYDFDTFTGQAKLRKKIFTDIVIFSPINPLGIAFSPDSKKLYYTAKEGVFSTLIQYSLETPSNVPLFNPKKRLFISKSIHCGNIQLAIDGKIYVSLFEKNAPDPPTSVKKIGVINSPNKADPEYKHLSLDLGNGNSLKGMPNFIQSYLRNRIITENKCVFEEFEFNVDAYAKINSVIWDFGDGSNSSSIAPKHIYTTPGEYTVTAKISYNGKTSTIYKRIEAYPLPVLKSGQNLAQCDPDNNGKDFFNLTTINPKISDEYQDLVFYYYTNENDARNDTNRIIDPESFENTSNPQKIYTRVINTNDCYQIKSFDIESVFVNISDLPELIVCEDSDNISGNQKGLFDLANQENVIRNLLSVPSSSTINFYPSQKDAQTLTNQVDSQFESESTTLWIRIENSLGCGGIKSFKLTVNPTPKIQLKDTYTLCFIPEQHAPLIVEADASNDTYEWKDSQNSVISNNQSLILTSPGKYSLTVYKQENGIICSNTKEFQVSYPTSPTFATLESNNSNDINTVFIEVSGNSTYEFSLDNQTFTGNSNSYTFTNITPGIKTVYVRDSNNCEPPIQQEVTVLGYPEFFTPNGDGINDTWNIPGATTTFFKEIDIKIFNRYGKVLYSINNNNAGIGWTGTFNNKILPSDNYWFKVRLIDYSGKIIEKTGNISLLRK